MITATWDHQSGVEEHWEGSPLSVLPALTPATGFPRYLKESCSRCAVHHHSQVRYEGAALSSCGTGCCKLGGCTERRTHQMILYFNILFLNTLCWHPLAPEYGQIKLCFGFCIPKDTKVFASGRIRKVVSTWFVLSPTMSFSSLARSSEAREYVEL